jgi:allene oxide cyclase
MRKILVLTVLAIALVAVAVVGVAAGAAPSAKKQLRGWARIAAHSSATAAAPVSGRGSEHLVLYAKTARQAVVDNGATGESTGDSFFFEESIWNQARTDRVGRDAVECVVGIRTFNCNGTLVLRDRGKIQVTGGFFSDADSTIPVTGGTGEFAGVGGALVVTDVSNNATRFDLYLTR